MGVGLGAGMGFGQVMGQAMASAMPGLVRPPVLLRRLLPSLRFRPTRSSPRWKNCMGWSKKAS
jgi:hypothetical protein